MSAARIAFFASFVALGLLSRHLEAASPKLTNATRRHDALDSEAVLLERYRRLIPYMTYYLVNNYVQQPQPAQPPAPTYTKAQALEVPAMMHRRPAAAQYVTLRPVMQLEKPRYQPPKLLDERFVPSVRYNPKELSQELDYFMPVRYGHKDVYHEEYTALRTSRPPPPPPQPQTVTISIPAGHYPTTSRPLNFQPQKLRPAPTPLTKIRPDYAAYGEGAVSPDDFEPVRFVPMKPRLQQQLAPTRYGQPRPTVLEPVVEQPAPRVSLNHVLKSLHLTNQLPEQLSKDNIDSSIRTLQEILSILNMGRKDNYAPAYEKFKPTYTTKPKVITESNYEATQLQGSPHNELIDPKLLSPYSAQIKAPLPGAPPPRPEVIELKPVAAYVGQTKPPTGHEEEEEEQLVEIKPASPYGGQVKVQPPVEHHQHHHHHHHQELVVEEEEEEEEVVVPPYAEQIKTQSPTPLLQQTTERPMVEEKKIVQYYVPIIQDIDEEKVVYNPSKEPAVPQTTVASTVSDYAEPESSDEILEDEKFTLPESTARPEVSTPQVPSMPPVLKYGATRGKPHIDYPAYSEIPETEFNCKQQRYKGFFGDPSTGCQVWHYCDLNGGKSSFLCPNGTIFSQVALTCDWWFNVKCESTTQLYVLNERLYKYILPIMPKFPEDFSGPEVDKYLELKFKEMEAKMKGKKEKKEQEEKDKNVVNTLQSIEDSK